MAIGNLPDVDFIVGFVLGRPGIFHRGVSHTAVAAVLFGVVAGTFAWWRRWDRWWPAVLLCAAAYGSHLLLDFFTVDQRPPLGAPFLWPFTDAYFLSPVSVFHEILIDGKSRTAFIWSIVAWPTVIVLAREALIAGASVATLMLYEAWRDGRAERTVAALAGSGEEDAA
jgi:hypothetical protein